MATPPERVDRQVSGAQIALVAVLVVVLLGLVWFMFLRGDGGEEEQAAPVATPTLDIFEELPEVEEEPDDDGRGPRGPLETFEVFAPRDPFEPLIAEQQAGDGATGDGAAGDGTTGDGGDANGTTGDAGTTGNGGAPSTATGGDVGGHTVRLVDSFTRNGNDLVQVEVDGTVYTVGEGETFAQNFQVLSIADRCADLLHGDDEFTLCEGEEILK